jgi:dTDP-4-amino-4,6-dideoxygalactose transaminase
MAKFRSMKGVKRASFGAEAYRTRQEGPIPNPFPRTLGPASMRYLQEVVDSGLTSDMVERFEKAFAAAVGARHCISAPGCNVALHLLFASLSFEPGDEVIVSPVTDFGTILGLCHEALIPVFPDTEPSSLNMSARTIEPCLTARTRAILVVHKSGILCDMDQIMALAQAHDLFVVDDACQTIFSTYKGRLVGTLADATAFSFDAEKTMGSDVGGALVTDDDDLAERMRFLGHSRGAEMRPHFGRIHTEPGFAFRMAQCTAAICLAQLETIRDNVANRDRVMRLLYPRLARIPGILPPAIPDYQEVFSCWMAGFGLDPEIIQCDPETFAREMDQAGIHGTGLASYYLMPEGAAFLNEKARAHLYPYSIPPAGRSYSYGRENCPNAASLLDHFVRWVISDRYSEQTVDLIVEIVQNLAKKYR